MLKPDELNSPNALMAEHHAPRTIPGIPSSRGIPHQPPPPRRIRWVRWIFLLAIVGVGVWAYYNRPPEQAGPARKVGGAAPVAIPVISGEVKRQDIPIYLDGLGTVQAFNSVLVRSRVDGQIVKLLFTEGEDVKVGDTLLQIDPNPYKAVLDQAIGKKGQDEAMLANARLDKQRYDDLLKRNVIASQQKDTQDALERQLTSALKADDAAIEAAQVQLDYTTITSPIEGRVGIRLVDVGNVIHAADTTGVVVVTQLRPIYVIFTLPEQTLASIRKETSNEPMKVIAVDRDNNSTLATGTLTVIDNTIDITTGTIKLKATFENKDLHLWPGQFVNARLLLSVRKGGIAVPASVIQRGPDSTYAFVIKKDQTVEIRPVKVGQIEDGQAMIDSGLEPGERVVVDGQYRLQPGSHVVEGGKNGDVKQQKPPQ